MRETNQILLIDDDPSFADLAATFLEREDERFTIETATSASEGLGYLTRHRVDCIVSDYDMSGKNGIEFLETVRVDFPDLPFILFTGKGSEDVASDAISAGVTDYLQKESDTSQYTILANRINNAIEQYSMGQVIEETEQKLSQISEQSDDVLFMFNADWSEILFINSAYEDIWGSPIAKLQDDPKSFLEYIHDQDQEKVVQSMNRLSNGEEDNTEYRVVRPDGEQRWVRARTKPIFNDDRTVSRIVGFVRDITNQKQHEKELKRTSDLFVQTERIADVGGWELDPDTMEVFWTKHLFELLKIDSDEAPPFREILEIYHEEDRSVVENAIESALNTGEAFDVEVRIQPSDDKISWLRVQGVPITEDGEVTTLRGAVQDITRHRNREQELEQARQEYEDLINGMNDIIWVTGSDGTFLTVNETAVETTGYSKEELLSMSPRDIDVKLEDDEIEALIRQLPEDGIQVFETINETKGGEQFPVEISSSLVTYRGDEVILSVARDISDRKARERKLEEFAFVVSHDLRNPLTVAQGHLELAREECDSGHLDEIDWAHNRMSALIEDLLTLAHEGDEIGESEQVDLAILVQNCWEHVETGEATLISHLDLTILADQSRLQQLLENLMRNAVDHGGTDVTVIVGELENGFYVEDDGPGIPEEISEKIFNTGYSTAEEGTGLGLSIIKQVADAHKWDITVTDGIDGGARFEIAGVNTVGK